MMYCACLCANNYGCDTWATLQFRIRDWHISVKRKPAHNLKCFKLIRTTRHFQQSRYSSRSDRIFVRSVSFPCYQDISFEHNSQYFWCVFERSLVQFSIVDKKFSSLQSLTWPTVLCCRDDENTFTYWAQLGRF